MIALLLQFCFTIWSLLEPQHPPMQLFSQLSLTDEILLCTVYSSLLKPATTNARSSLCFPVLLSLRGSVLDLETLSSTQQNAFGLSVGEGAVSGLQQQLAALMASDPTAAASRGGTATATQQELLQQQQQEQVGGMRWQVEHTLPGLHGGKAQYTTAAWCSWLHHISHVSAVGLLAPRGMYLVAYLDLPTWKLAGGEVGTWLHACWHHSGEPSQSLTAVYRLAC